eukprot:Partr_v1_DN24023_c0_g1_i1_m34661 putative NADPH oxidase activator 1
MDITDMGAKIFFNMGIVYTSIDRHEDAAISYTNAIFQDKYLAVAYFQRGVSQWLLNDYAAALDSFTDTIEYLRDNMQIDYHQLGLAYKLYSFEALFNRALCFLALGDEYNARLDLEDAEKDAVLTIHQQDRYTPSAVMKAYAEGNLKSYLPFVVPKGLLYKPHEHKIKNAEEIDYLGSGKVIASVTEGDDFVGFNGPSHAASMAGMSADEMREKELARDNRRSSEASSTVSKSLSLHSRKTPLSDRRPSNETRLTNPAIDSLKITSPGSESVSSGFGSDRWRIKCHYKSDRRMIMVPKGISFDELRSKIFSKYDLRAGKLKYRDDEGEFVLMTDEGDLDIALSALESSDTNRLEVFIE